MHWQSRLEKTAIALNLIGLGFGFGAESGDDVTFSVVGLSDASGERDGEVSGCALEGFVSMLT